MGRWQRGLSDIYLPGKTCICHYISKGLNEAFYFPGPELT
ncbi:hypothetical protein PRUB_a3533 [Pseudoalteromonas rubra]|uniref:Uncharacterized protein n=1 Tax=Pseudoalteromonas rubra TaxID=43658 RepID=A0A8T0C522_9GAMM|nr:hypothetical protein PRUB_a3533 [Pseudoalteromonas rubra]